MPGAPSSFLLLVAMPFVTSSVLVTTSKALVTLVPNSFLLLAVKPGATSSFLDPYFAGF